MTYAQYYPVIDRNDKSTHFVKFEHDSIATKNLLIIPSYQNYYDCFPRLDKNDNQCVLLRVITSNDSTIRFEGNIVGDVEYHDGSYWLYLSKGSHLLSITNGNDQIRMDLNRQSDEKINLKGGKTYNLCGLDSGNNIILNPYIEITDPMRAREIRKIARMFIDNINGLKTDSIKQLSGNAIAPKGSDLNNLYELLKDDSKKGNIKASMISGEYHMSKQYVYGLTFQIEDSSAVLGYVFLLLDLNDLGTPLIHVSTWQPVQVVAKDGVFTLDDFFIP